jgi:hypothetical protein
MLFPKYALEDLTVGSGSIIGKGNIEEFFNHVSMHKDVEDISLAELAPSYVVVIAYLVHFFPIHHRAPNSPPYCLPSQIVARSSAKTRDPSYHRPSSSSWSWEPSHRPICAMDSGKCVPHLLHLGFVYIYEMCIVSEILYGVIPSSGIFHSS